MHEEHLHVGRTGHDGCEGGGGNDVARGGMEGGYGGAGFGGLGVSEEATRRIEVLWRDEYGVQVAESEGVWS